ncbi:MAG: electron transport complex subunit RsxE [Lentisphaeria bacterium]
MKLKEIFMRGIWKDNPVLILLLGMCPTLAVTTGMKNGLGMGLATTFVLIGSNCVISALKKIIPSKVRIPCYIVIIATFVTLVEMLMQAYAPAVNDALGIFIPLIVVNCIVLGRAEAFAAKNNIIHSLFDALGMGLGFTLALSLLGAIREFFCGGTLFDIKLIPAWNTEFLLMKFAPGAFIALGVILALMNKIEIRKAKKEGRVYLPPAELNCSKCRICKIEEI